MESPGVWFEDFGSLQLVNGYAKVILDELYLETVHIDDDHPMHVFLQDQGECNGLYVIPDKDGFEVFEKDKGKSNITVSYRITAKRKHFQDHRFGNDPVWGEGDTRKYSQYAPPPPIDYHEKISFRKEQRLKQANNPLPPNITRYKRPSIKKRKEQ